MIGQTLSHYRITGELGRGGMGIVYKAEDTKLERTVAIKVLPSATLASEDDRSRFYREAKAAAQLHHPNIASIFEIDEAVPSDAPHDAQPSPFIAMEFIDGETLSSRITKGPLKISDAVRTATQIASALEAAHEKNIVHRDVKSANVMVTSKGGAKVLDFGLAKTAHSTMLTRMGSTLGTFAYMSPEQARGGEVDRRTDIWALGVVLYEMVSGRHPFPGDYEQAVVYAILNQDPEPLTAVRTGVPMELERIVGKLLSKDPSRRYQTIADLIADLKGLDVPDSSVQNGSGQPRSHTSMPGAASPAWLSSGNSVAEAPTATVRFTPARVGLIAIFALLVGLAVGRWSLGGTAENEATPVVRRLSMDFKGLSQIDAPGISPDGRYLVFTAKDSTTVSRIYIYSFERGEVVASHPDPGFRYIRFSPDGRWLALSAIGAGISTILLPDGVPQTVTTLGEWALWESNESLIYRLNSNLYRIPATGGEPELVARPDSSRGLNRLWPADIVPGTDIALVSGAGGGETDRGIYALDLKTGQYRLLIDKAIAAWILDEGHVIYSQGGGLVGQLVVRAFDFARMEPYGLPAPFNVQPLDWTKWAVGKDGTVIYTGESAAGHNVGTWIGIDGSPLGNWSIPDGQYVRMEFSPTGDRLAAVRLDYQTYGDGWVFDVEGERAPTRLTQTPTGRAIAWARNGSTIYFGETGQSGTRSTLLSVRADGGGVIDTVRTFENLEIDWLSALPDGRRLLFYDRIGNDLFLYSIEDDLLESVTNSPTEEELSPSVSPDGRFVAYYDVDQPGSRILVKELGGAGRWEILDVRLGMRNPVWSADGRYLFFATMTGQVYRHRIGLNPTFSPIGQPELIADFPGSIPVLAVHPDGERLLVSSSLVLADRDQSLNFIFNFREEAKRIAPVR